VGGGTMRDLLLDRHPVPILLRQTELYATACIVGVGVYLVAQTAGIDQEAASYLGMVTVAGLRFAAIRWNLKLPVFRVPEDGAVGL
jgi:uncharacterized membrane protein YeiH